MKTTIEIATPLFNEARAAAQLDGTTLRALVEKGLRLALAERKGREAPFKLRDASVGGKGLHADAHRQPWDRLRARSYEARGG